MEATNLPDALKLIMDTRGWRQSDLAHELGVSQAFVSQLINGKRDLALAKLMAHLARVGWEVRITPKAEGDDPVKRRQFVTSAASVIFMPSAGVSPYRDPAYVRSLVKWVARNRYEHGGNAALSSVVRHLHNVQLSFDSEDKELQLAGSDLACEAVWTLNDVTRYRAAENAGRMALELGRRSGSQDAQSRAYSALSAINTSRGQSDRAVAYAKQGLKLRGVDPAQHTWLALRLAWAMSPLRGEELNVRRTIEGVQVFLENTGGFGMSAFEKSELIGGIGSTLRIARAYPDALRSLNEAVDLTRQSSILLNGYYLQQEIMTVLATRNPVLAATKISTLARIAPLVSSARIDGNARKILDRSATWSSVPEMRDAREHLQSVMTPSRG